MIRPQGSLGPQAMAANFLESGRRPGLDHAGRRPLLREGVGWAEALMQEEGPGHCSSRRWPLLQGNPGRPGQSPEEEAQHLSVLGDGVF